MSSLDYSEDTLIEQPAIQLFAELGWTTVRCMGEFDGAGGSALGRGTKAEVVLVRNLRAALARLNPSLPAEAVEQAIEELTRSRGMMGPVQANREIHKLLREGVPVKIGASGRDREQDAKVRVIDWGTPANNEFLLASQFRVSGEYGNRRADLIGFVNGLPLLFIELKAAHRALRSAFTGNLTDYKTIVPQLFWYNAFVVLSNGSLSRIGSISAEWEHFADWKKITSEGETGIIPLETMIRGTCRPDRFLDVVENFTLFMEKPGGLEKVIAKNHQYLGVNNALGSLHDIREKDGRLGVFWHTQGSGKSYSMVFFAQKVLRRIPGNWTFVIVTDRRELDTQIYGTFASAGAVTEEEAHATSAAHLRQLLTEDHRYVFTLIHKFRTEGKEEHPKLSDRSDIVVITDEAHRSQYDQLALNMRNALPNASFLAFTGTPLMEGEERTRSVFGDYISIYNFRQSIEDGATVPLYYENRVPEVQLTNDQLNEEMEDLLDRAELNEEQEKKLEREFAREYHLITRDERLETIAADIVSHFMGRGYRGKAMVIGIDKATAVRMHDKVRARWKIHRDELAARLPDAGPEELDALDEQIRWMDETDMAVVVSGSQNEIAEMRKKGLEIEPHRKRMMTEDLEKKFKDPSDPFRIVFVCAMWLTGFDAPSCSTLYLDKPMRNHTLMQTIARANRVFSEKVSGLIVDYIGVFRNLKKALAIYGSGSGGGIEEGEMPVQDKAMLVEELRRALAEATAFCGERGIDPDTIVRASGFERVRLLGDAKRAIAGTDADEEVEDAVDAMLGNDEIKKRYLTMANVVGRLYKAILPDAAANEFGPTCALIDVIARKIRSAAPDVDIGEVMAGVEALLDRSIAPKGYIIREEDGVYGGRKLIDLSRVDFDALRREFERGRKHIEIERLKGAITGKLGHMLLENRSRVDFLERFRRMIDEYNAGSHNVEELFEQLVGFVADLNEEEKRGIAEGLTEEELALFDLLKEPGVKLGKKEELALKTAARDLLESLKWEKLVLDWRKRQQAIADVRVTIETVLDRDLPASYSTELFDRKCTAVFQHVYDAYVGAGVSVYSVRPG